jgi:hypothetical protein
VEARFVVLVSSTLVVLLTANVVSVILAWRQIGDQFEEFRSALRVVAPGARVIAFREEAGIDPSLPRGPLYVYTHMPALAVIERDAYLPFLFKNPMDPVGAAPALKAIDVPHGMPITLAQLIEGADPVKGPAMLGTVDGLVFRNYWGDWPQHYDYAVELSFGAKPTLPSQLKLLASGPIFNIYQIKK